jgi:hypothetical protein
MKYTNRLFINRDEGLAAIEWYVEGEDFITPYVSASFAIADCSRKAVLEFDIYGENRSLDERVEKVDTIIRELTAFKQALILEYTEVKAKSAQKKKKKGKKKKS